MVRWISAAALVAAFTAIAPAAADEQQIAYGEYLSGECVTCHQLTGKSNGIPAIVGWEPDVFVAVFEEYRNKTRGNEAMQTIANRLKDDEIAALAAYFATQMPLH